MLSTQYSCQILMTLQFSRQIIEKYSVSNLKKPSGRSQVVPRGQMDRRTDMTTLTVAFRNFSNVPKNDL